MAHKHKSYKIMSKKDSPKGNTNQLFIAMLLCILTNRKYILNEFTLLDISTRFHVRM